MSRRIIFIFGVIMLLSGVLYGYFVLATSRQASLADSSSIESGAGGGGQKPLCKKETFELTEIVPSDRVMSETDTIAITAVLSNKSDKECDVVLSLTVPNFEVDPAERSLVVLRPGMRTESFVWLLTPQKQGSFQARITAEVDGLVRVNHIVGLAVTNILGLSPRSAKIASILGTFLGGSSFTLPTLIGWYKSWQQTRAKRSQKPKKR